MSISSTSRKAGPFACNGVTTTFSFSFKVFEASDLLVVLTDSSDAESELVLNTGYTVTLNADQNVSPGGSITTTATHATGYKVTITTEVPATQDVTIPNGGAFYPGVLNDALDRLTVLVQQVQEQVSRCIKTAISSDASPDAMLASISQAVSDAETAAAAAQAAADAFGGAGRVVDAVAVLRTLPKTGSPTAFVLGNSAKGDGNGGAYYYDSTDTTSPDNGSTILVASDGGRWKSADALKPSTQPANAWRDLVVPTVGTTYVDNVLTIENRSQNTLGKRGNAAIRFRDALTGYERAAVGYSALATDNPAYYPNLFYCEVGNLSADAQDTDFAVVATHVAGATNFPNTSLKAIEVKSSTGEISLRTQPTARANIFLEGNPYIGKQGEPMMVSTWGASTMARWRERDSDDLFALTSNVNNGTTKDNVAKAAWRVQWGYGIGGDYDRFAVSRMDIGSATWVEYFKVNANAITIGATRASTAKATTSPITGTTVSIPQTVETQIIDPAGTLAALTVGFPPSPVDGQFLTISFTQAITALTLTSGQTIKNTYTAASAGQVIKYVYNAANTTWYRA